VSKLAAEWFNGGVVTKYVKTHGNQNSRFSLEAENVMDSMSCPKLFHNTIKHNNRKVFLGKAGFQFSPPNMGRKPVSRVHPVGQLT
jgi:hypothetical protein